MENIEFLNQQIKETKKAIMELMQKEQLEASEEAILDVRKKDFFKLLSIANIVCNHYKVDFKECIGV